MPPSAAQPHQNAIDFEQVLDERHRAIHRDIYAAFGRSADAANIIQGVREFRSGRPHVRIVMHPSAKCEFSRKAEQVLGGLIT